MTGPRKQLIVKLTGLWYLCLGLAFASLAWRSVLYDAPMLGIVLRCIIAVAFCVLGVMTLRSAKR